MGAAPEGGGVAVVVAAKRMRVGLEHIEFRHIEFAATLISIAPNKKHFIRRIQRVDLKLIVTITAVDKQFTRFRWAIRCRWRSQCCGGVGAS